MASWQEQIDSLIAPAVNRSEATNHVVIGHGVLSSVGEVAGRIGPGRKALVMADMAGFAAAGQRTVAALEGAGFTVETLVKSADPLPKASVEEAEAFRAALAADEGLLPVSVGSGVINDLVKFAAFQTNRPYMTVATAASMDGYTSAGAPLARGGFKVTIPTRAPVAMVADLDVIASAPAEMNGWGYADLAGKSPAGGDWVLADLVGAEPVSPTEYGLVQDHLRGWLAGPDGIRAGDADSVARLFVGLTAVGFAMEFHGTSRPASGADHQIAHMWEMEDLTLGGRKVSHGAAVAVGCLTSLALYDWLLAQDLSRLDDARIVAEAPSLEARLVDLDRHISDPKIKERARDELAAKHVGHEVHAKRLARIRAGWPNTKVRLSKALYRADEMATMLRAAGAPSTAADIGVTPDHLERTMLAAPFIRRRYTIFDFLHDTGLWAAARTAIVAQGSEAKGSAA